MKAFKTITSPASAIHAFAVICQQVIKKETLSPQVTIPEWEHLFKASRPRVQKSLDELASVGLVEFYDKTQKGIRGNRFIMLTQKGLDTAKELSEMFGAASNISAINIAAGMPSDWCMARYQYQNSPLAKVCPDSF